MSSLVKDKLSCLGPCDQNPGSAPTRLELCEVTWTKEADSSCEWCNYRDPSVCSLDKSLPVTWEQTQQMWDSVFVLQRGHLCAERQTQFSKEFCCATTSALVVADADLLCHFCGKLLSFLRRAQEWNDGLAKGVLYLCSSCWMLAHLDEPKCTKGLRKEWPARMVKVIAKKSLWMNLVPTFIGLSAPNELSWHCSNFNGIITAASHDTGVKSGAIVFPRYNVFLCWTTEFRVETH